MFNNHVVPLVVAEYFPTFSSPCQPAKHRKLKQWTDEGLNILDTAVTISSTKNTWLCCSLPAVNSVLQPCSSFETFRPTNWASIKLSKHWACQRSRQSAPIASRCVFLEAVLRQAVCHWTEFNLHVQLMQKLISWDKKKKRTCFYNFSNLVKHELSLISQSHTASNQTISLHMFKIILDVLTVWCCFLNVLCSSLRPDAHSPAWPGPEIPDQHPGPFPRIWPVSSRSGNRHHQRDAAGLQVGSVAQHGTC